MINAVVHAWILFRGFRCCLSITSWPFLRIISPLVCASVRRSLACFRSKAKSMYKPSQIFSRMSWGTCAPMASKMLVLTGGRLTCVACSPMQRPPTHWPVPSSPTPHWSLSLTKLPRGELFPLCCSKSTSIHVPVFVGDVVGRLWLGCTLLRFLALRRC